MSAVGTLLQLVAPKNANIAWAEAYREAIREEAKVGGRVFGPIPKNVRREFFCLDENTWVWHEEWKDDAGKQHIRTTRYDVRPQGIFKAQNGHAYQPVSRQEAGNFIAAIKKYNSMIDAELAPLLAA